MIETNLKEKSDNSNELFSIEDFLTIFYGPVQDFLLITELISNSK